MMSVDDLVIKMFNPNYHINLLIFLNGAKIEATTEPFKSHCSHLTWKYYVMPYKVNKVTRNKVIK